MAGLGEWGRTFPCYYTGGRVGHPASPLTCASQALPCALALLWPSTTCLCQCPTCMLLCLSMARQGGGVGVGLMAMLGQRPSTTNRVRPPPPLSLKVALRALVVAGPTSLPARGLEQLCCSRPPARAAGPQPRHTHCVKCNGRPCCVTHVRCLSPFGAALSYSRAQTQTQFS